MKFCIQDPLYEGSVLLHESLLSSCKQALYGGGTYAFVTADGANLFLGDKIFAEYMKCGKYTLIIGIDEITSNKALNKLKELKIRYGDNLQLYAFLHTTKGSTYHSKYSWFRTSTGGILVLGSGNLTQKGLRKNREAFNVIELDEKGILEVENQWKSWIETNKDFIKPIDDSAVIQKAEENAMNVKWARTHKSDKSSKLSIPEVVEHREYIIERDNDVNLLSGNEEDDAWFFEMENKILFAEIPRSKNRWKQANFDKETFEIFFGARCGENGEYRVLLRNIDSSRGMGNIESRPAVSVVSKNYRFELEAAAGLDYPDNGRPIAVFVKVSYRTFLYELFMPGFKNYDSVLKFIDETEPPGSKMRRIVVSVAECLKKCSDLTIWNNLIDDEEFV